MPQAATDSAKEDAVANGLRYLGDDQAGISRLKRGDGFTYLAASGKKVRDVATLKRIKHLAIPPAWTDVWISPAVNGHLQATGRDARGRKQYRYHDDFRAARDKTKYEHIFAFGSAIEKIRRRIKVDMRRRGLPREKVLATVVRLLDTTLIRVGNDEYARANGSFGITTLRDRHVDIAGDALSFEFVGKSGKVWHLQVRDRRVARIVKSCQDLPGQHLFQYLDENGERQSFGSADVNAYLREITGLDVTAKDFRTFAGTVLAATALSQFKPFTSVVEAKVNIRAAVDEVADRLGNTPAICRRCYIHPEVLAAYVEGGAPPLGNESTAAQGAAREHAVLRFLRSRLKQRGRSRGRRMAGQSSRGSAVLEAGA